VTPRTRALLRPSLVGAIAAVPDLAIAGGCVAAWIAPERIGAQWVEFLVVGMGMEFVVINATAAMLLFGITARTRASGVVGLVGVGLFASVLVAILCRAAGTWWPMAGFWILTANRALGVLLGQAPSGEESDLVTNGWVTSLVLYCVAVFAVTFLELPSGGLTPAVVGDLELVARFTWTPLQNVLAAGCAYFAVVALFEATDFRWMDRALRRFGRMVLLSR
jgi:hypothetical protein